MIPFTVLGGGTHVSYTMCVHAAQASARETFIQFAEPTIGPLCKKLSMIDEDDLSPSIRERGWRLCRRLDDAIALRDLTNVDASVSVSNNGALLVQFNASGFLLFFAVEDAEKDSGWGLATHKSSGGLIAGGPLSSADISSVLGLVIHPVRIFRARSFAAS